MGVETKLTDGEKTKLIEGRFRIIQEILKKLNEEVEFWSKGDEFVECSRCGKLCREEDWD